MPLERETDRDVGSGSSDQGSGLSDEGAGLLGRGGLGSRVSTASGVGILDEREAGSLESLVDGFSDGSGLMRNDTDNTEALPSTITEPRQDVAATAMERPISASSSSAVAASTLASLAGFSAKLASLIAAKHPQVVLLKPPSLDTQHWADDCMHLNTEG